METEADVIESLKAVGHDGKFLTTNILQDAIQIGPKSESFRELVTWITFEIHVLRKTDEKITKDTDFNEFMLEMSGMLKELGCPYSQFIDGPLTGRLYTKESRMLLLDYLLSELMALKMCLKLKPEENSYIIPMFESSTAQALQSITKELNLGKPPDNIGAKALFEKISNRLDEAIKKTNAKKLSQPLFKPTVALTDEQWSKLSKLQKELDQEYNLRRQMLLTRLEVTIQSFQWSEKMKGREEDIVKRYQKKKQILDGLQYGATGTDIPALLAARQDLAIIEKTSSANVRKNTGTQIQKHVIGKVPDRGGRAYEHAPPPPEMPSWQQNRASGPAGGGRGGGGNRGGGGGRGGRGGGGNWNQQSGGGQQQYQGNNGGFNQRQNFDQRQQFEQRPQFEQQRQQYDQRPQYDNRDNQGFSGNNNRVQGGWSQRGNDRNTFGGQQGNSGHFGSGDNSYRGNNQYNNTQGGGGGGHYGGQNQGGGNYGNSDRGNFRGRSSYNRGGANRR